MLTNFFKYKVAPTAISLNLLYSFTDFRLKDFYYSLRFARLSNNQANIPAHTNSSQYFVQCFEKMFCPVNKYEKVASILINFRFLTMFEYTYGSSSLLIAICFAYIGTLVCSAPSDKYKKKLEKQKGDTVFNSQLFNIASLCYLAHKFKTRNLPRPKLKKGFFTKLKLNIMRRLSNQPRPLLKIKKVNIRLKQKGKWIKIGLLVWVYPLGFYLDFNTLNLFSISNHYDFRTAFSMFLLVAPLLPSIVKIQVNSGVISFIIKDLFKIIKDSKKKRTIQRRKWI